VYITVVLVASAATARGQGDADALYRDREHLASAARAAQIWQSALGANPRDFDTAWKLARVRHWLGDHAASADREAEFEGGATAARVAVGVRPDRPEGHFWLGANLGSLAQAGGVMAGLKYRAPIRKAFEEVLRLDRAFDRGAGLCALSNYYLKVPALFGGSKARAETFARECVAADPNSTLAHFFLAEALVARDRTADARAELQTVLAVPLDPDYIPEGKEWKGKATALLSTLR
jgi:hypothetical protein